MTNNMKQFKGLLLQVKIGLKAVFVIFDGKL